VVGHAAGERQDLVEQGWGIGLADVPVVAGWSVRIRAGRFVGIRRAGGSDEYWTAPDSTLMPEPWLRAASDHGRVLVLVVSPGALDGAGAADLDDKILELAAADDLAAGLLALDLDGER